VIQFLGNHSFTHDHELNFSTVAKGQIGRVNQIAFNAEVCPILVENRVLPAWGRKEKKRMWLPTQVPNLLFQH